MFRVYSESTRAKSRISNCSDRKKTNSKSVWVRLNHLWIDRYLLKVNKEETRTKPETFAKPKKVKSEQYQSRQLFSRVLPTFHLLFSLCLCLTLSWRRPLSYRNQSTDLQSKAMDWFLYDNSFRHERVNVKSEIWQRPQQIKSENVNQMSLNVVKGLWIL